MKNSNFFTIQPIDYNQAISALDKAQMPDDEKKQILKVLADHKMLIETKNIIIKEQIEVAEGIFAFGKNQDNKANGNLPQADDNNVTQPAVENNLNNDNTATNPSNADKNIDDSAKDLKSKPKKRVLPLGVITRHGLAESDKTCNYCGTNMVRSKIKTKTIVICKPLISTETHEVENRRCLNCNCTKEAPKPAILNQTIGRYHHSVIATIIALRYQYGMASYRLQALSKDTGLEISDSTQWFLFEKAASRVIGFVRFLEKTIANAPTQHLDDTNMMVLALARMIVTGTPDPREAQKN